MNDIKFLQSILCNIYKCPDCDRTEPVEDIYPKNCLFLIKMERNDNFFFTKAGYDGIIISKPTEKDDFGMEERV